MIKKEVGSPNVRMCATLAPAHSHNTQCATAHSHAHYPEGKTLEAMIDRALVQCSNRTKDRTLPPKVDRTLRSSFIADTHNGEYDLSIPYEAPYFVDCFDPELDQRVERPFTETECFIEGLAKARDFLRAIYLRQIDTVIEVDNSLNLVQYGRNKPSSTDWRDALRYQHGIRAHLLGEPFNLYEICGAAL